jgi:RNA polymerase sigma-70 factor (ECF subfamily)
MTTTSISLLERLRRPENQPAWREFVQLYTPLIYDWACGTGVTPADAEDLVQDVMAILVQRLPEFEYDPGRSFRGWLRTITINRRRDFFRRRGVRPHPTADGRIEAESPGGACDMLAEDEYRRYLVSRALEIMQNEFEPTTWKAYWECVVHEQSPAKVAADLGMTVNAVYVAKSRVLRRLRSELEGLLD